MLVKLGGLGVQSVEGLALPSYIESLHAALHLILHGPSLPTKESPSPAEGPLLPTKSLLCLQRVSYIYRGASYTYSGAFYIYRGLIYLRKRPLTPTEGPPILKRGSCYTLQWCLLYLEDLLCLRIGTIYPKRGLQYTYRGGLLDPSYLQRISYTQSLLRPQRELL